MFFENDKVVMYNYGSPRVGNLQFVNRFNSGKRQYLYFCTSKASKLNNTNAVAAVNEAFRVVNDADVVARVPRSRGTSSDVSICTHCTCFAVQKYKH